MASFIVLWRTIVSIDFPHRLTWSRDGQDIYFVTADSIFRVRVTDGKLEKLASPENGSGIQHSPWFSLAPDDSPLVLRDMSTQEIYALDWEAP